jgi:hypothetical protein
MKKKKTNLKKKTKKSAPKRKRKSSVQEPVGDVVVMSPDPLASGPVLDGDEDRIEDVPMDEEPGQKENADLDAPQIEEDKK